MAQSNPIGIYHKGDEIIFYGRRKNGKDIPGSRWASITAPGQRALLDNVDDLSTLKYSRRLVTKRSAAILAEKRKNIRNAQDLAWLQDERQQALLEVLIDEINKLGANPQFSTNRVETAYLKKLSVNRGG